MDYIKIEDIRDRRLRKAISKSPLLQNPTLNLRYLLTENESEFINVINRSKFILGNGIEYEKTIYGDPKGSIDALLKSNMVLNRNSLPRNSVCVLLVDAFSLETQKPSFIFFILYKKNRIFL